MKFLLSRFLVLLLLVSCRAEAQVTVTHLLTENREYPLGLDIRSPRLSWQLASEDRGVVQSAYEIRMYIGKDLWWNSGKMESDQSVFVHYGGPELQSNRHYRWQVRVWDGKGHPSEWSKDAFFHTGFFQSGEWKAKWIEMTGGEPSNRPAHMFRKDFTVTRPVHSAMLYITAHGIYEAYLNGQRVGDAYLTPGWTSYDKRIQYQVYDVSGLMQNGANAMGVEVGNGWYRSNLAWEGHRDIYGQKLGLLAQLMVEYSDGTREIFITDESWKSDFSAVVYTEIYHGETIDARKFQTGWNMPGFNDSEWRPVREVYDLLDDLIGTYNEPVRKQETFEVVKVLTSPKGEKILDFGQNLVGWVIVRTAGKMGDQIVLSHSEVLDKDGNFYTESLRTAKQQMRYILKGEGEEVFEPHFTWQGFRYVRVDTCPGEINPHDFTAVAVYSDMRKTGTFTSSNELINQLQQNIQWGQKGNFLDVPTDCPQRDERLGWTGDAQAFSRTAAFNFDVHNFFAKWMKDVAADQLSNGSVPFVVPNVLGSNAGASAGWADAATIIPWNMYLVYGDRQILADQYESMRSWVRYMTNNSTDHLWNKGFHFGDWLFYRPFDDTDGRSAVTDKYLIAQCFYAHSTQILINTASILGKNEDVKLYTELLDNIKAAFLREYVTPSGRLVSGTQTAYVLALNFDMLPESMRQQAADRLAENIRSYDDHLTTGFLGTPYLCHVLSRFGHTETAFRLLLQKTYPSWLYPVTMGATTIWERWDGIKPDGTFQTPGMNSFNHYAYGAIGDWMYRVLVGLDNEEHSVGFKKISIKPHIGGDFTHAGVEYHSVYGSIATGWKIHGDKLEIDAIIPPNTSAMVYLPVGSEDQVLESNRALNAIQEIQNHGLKDDRLLIEIPSGKYHFQLPWQENNQPDK